MDNTYLGGKRSGGKRRRGSPGKQPIVVPVQNDEKGRPRRIKRRRITRFKRSRMKSLTKHIVAPGATAVTDVLSCFRGVADAGCQHIAIKTGSGRHPARHPAFKWVNTVLGNSNSTIVGTYRAVSRKHTARMLAEFEWRFNNCFDLAAMIPTPVRAALSTKPQPPHWQLKLADYGA